MRARWRTIHVTRTRGRIREICKAKEHAHISPRAHTHTHTHIHVRTRAHASRLRRACGIVTLTDAKAHLLEFLPTEESRSGGKCPPSSIALLKAIFLTLAIVEDPNWKYVTTATSVLHKFARVNMDDYHTCPRHCCATEKCNKSCALPLLLLRRIRWNRALIAVW